SMATPSFIAPFGFCARRSALSASCGARRRGARVGKLLERTHERPKRGCREGDRAPFRAARSHMPAVGGAFDGAEKPRAPAPLPKIGCAGRQTHRRTNAIDEH